MPIIERSPLLSGRIDRIALICLILASVTSAACTRDGGTPVHSNLRRAPQGKPEAGAAAGAAEERFQSSPLPSSRRPFL